MIPKTGFSRGFVMTTEALFSTMLLAIAASSLALFHFPSHDPQGFYLCSDAAMVLAKSGAFFGQDSLEDAVKRLGELSHMCISTSSAALLPSSSCLPGEEGGEKFSFTLPVFDGSGTRSATVSCSRPK